MNTLCRPPISSPNKRELHFLADLEVDEIYVIIYGCNKICTSPDVSHHRNILQPNFLFRNVIERKDWWMDNRPARHFPHPNEWKGASALCACVSEESGEWAGKRGVNELRKRNVGSVASAGLMMMRAFFLTVSTSRDLHRTMGAKVENVSATQR